MPDCRRCGLLDIDEQGGQSCVKFGTQAIGLSGGSECGYFTEITMDGAVRFSPREHLALKEQEREGRRMKGPV